MSSQLRQCQLTQYGLRNIAGLSSYHWRCYDQRDLQGFAAAQRTLQRHQRMSFACHSSQGLLYDQCLLCGLALHAHTRLAVCQARLAC